MAFDRDSAKEAGAKSTRKGVGNKSTTIIRDRVVKLIQDNFETFEADLKLLKPKERIDTLMKLMNFTIPKVKAIETNELLGLDEHDKKLIEAMEYDKERKVFLDEMLARAKEDKARRDAKRSNAYN